VILVCVLMTAFVWLATGALVVAAKAHGRDDEQDARLAALEREADDLGPLPPERPPSRPPIGFRSD
jgi:hypothetical protein